VFSVLFRPLRIQESCTIPTGAYSSSNTLLKYNFYKYKLNTWSY